MFKNKNYLPKEPLPEGEPAAIQRIYDPFNNIMLGCYNLVVVVVMDVYVHHKFCKSLSCLALA